jgi:TnpA family transposase
VPPLDFFGHDCLAPAVAPLRRPPPPIKSNALATLGLKEIPQGTLIRKLCTYASSHPTWWAIFEYDRLVRSVYTLRYLRDPQLQRNVHRSQNRIESYHHLRVAIAQVGGKKEPTGRTDIETSNQCGRLIANAILFYNSAILLIQALILDQSVAILRKSGS